jgi:hypothetical protein
MTQWIHRLQLGVVLALLILLEQILEREELQKRSDKALKLSSFLPPLNFNLL